MIEDPRSLTAVVKLSKDAIAAMRAGAAPASGAPGGGLIGASNATAARMLVDLYYTMQEVRKGLGNQSGAIQSGADPSGTDYVVQYALNQAEVLEHNASLFLGQYAASHLMWPWLNAVHGIGPVLAAGLLAHLGGRPLPPTVGHWWRYAGLDPSQRWLGADDLRREWDALTGDVEERARVLARIVGRDPETVLRDATVDFRTGEAKPLTRTNAIKSLARIPFNRPLKTLCWKIGDSFVKLGERNDQAFYAKFYRQRKADEIARNLRGDRAELAARTLAQKPNHAQKATYADGRLPDGRVDLMARRATVKLFLSHLHEVWWGREHGTQPPKPFSIGIQGHAHYIAPPYLHVFGEEAAAA